MIVKNKEYEDLFRAAWAKYIAHLSQTGASKLPEISGPGFLQTVAARHNLCTATWKEGDDWAVCAASLRNHPSDDPYLCYGCHKKKMQEMMAKMECEELAEPTEQYELTAAEDELPF